MTLRNRLLALLISSLLIPLLISGVLTFWYFNNKLHSEAETYQRNIAQQIVSNVESEFNTLAVAANHLAHDALLKQYFAMDYESRVYLLQPAVLQLFNGFSVLLKDFTQVQLWNAAGRREVFVIAGEQKDIVPLGIPVSVFDDMKLLDMTSGVFIVSAEQGQHFLATVVPVIDEVRDPDSLQLVEVLRGYLVMVLPMITLVDMVEDLKKDASHFVFVNHLGDTLVNSENLPFSQLPELTLSDEAAADDFILDVIDVEGKTYWMSLYQLHSEIWLVSLIDGTVINAISTDFLVRLMWPLLAILGTVGVVFYFVVLRLVNEPIDRLIKATRRIGGGDYSLDTDGWRNDEIGDLAQSLGEMSEQIALSNARIQKLAYYDSLTNLPNRSVLRQTLRLGKLVSES